MNTTYNAPIGNVHWVYNWTHFIGSNYETFWWTVYIWWWLSIGHTGPNGDNVQNVHIGSNGHTGPNEHIGSNGHIEPNGHIKDPMDTMNGGPDGDWVYTDSLSPRYLLSQIFPLGPMCRLGPMFPLGLMSPLILQWLKICQFALEKFNESDCPMRSYTV